MSDLVDLNRQVTALCLSEYDLDIPGGSSSDPGKRRDGIRVSRGCVIGEKARKGSWFANSGAG